MKRCTYSKTGASIHRLNTHKPEALLCSRGTSAGAAAVGAAVVSDFVAVIMALVADILCMLSLPNTFVAPPMPRPIPSPAMVAQRRRRMTSEIRGNLVEDNGPVVEDVSCPR